MKLDALGSLIRWFCRKACFSRSKPQMVFNIEVTLSFICQTSAIKKRKYGQKKYSESPEDQKKNENIFEQL